MQELIGQLARLHFDGEKRRGKRRTFIFKKLEGLGLCPYYDEYGNIWVEQGSGKPLKLFSSHIDVDSRIRPSDMKKSIIKNGIALGVLDNAVGCALNILLAKKKAKKGSCIHLFTASEEAAPAFPSVFARSAKEVVRILKKRHLVPSFCVAIDVTYPKLLVPHYRLALSKDDTKAFYLYDTTHCYIDGYSDSRSYLLASRLLEKAGTPNIKIRKLIGHDEAFVYRAISPSFAFGPVVFGSFDQPGQSMPIAHAKTAMQFLKLIK
ncbi:MAG: hypothetical protein N3G80_03055 [Candidatus Micrarchaeota archaeon]|nr:hypothetical protein [Candidatus Micrarchaeota archaeon]